MKLATIINLLFPGEFEINYRYMKIFHDFFIYPYHPKKSLPTLEHLKI